MTGIPVVGSQTVFNGQMPGEIYFCELYFLVVFYEWSILKESSNVLSFYVLVFSQACDTFKSALPSQLFFLFIERIFIKVYGFLRFTFFS